MCDSSKAFDNVSHEILLLEICGMGVDSFSFKDYLAYSLFVWEKNVPTTLNISDGVPQ